VSKSLSTSSQFPMPWKFTFLLALFGSNLIPWPTDAKS